MTAYLELLYPIFSFPCYLFVSLCAAKVGNYNFLPKPKGTQVDKGRCDKNKFPTPLI